MSKKNTQIIKDALNTSDLTAGGIMSKKQALKFIRMVFDTTPLLQSVRTISLPSPKFEIDKIGIGRRLMRGYQSENEDFYQYTKKPNFGKIELDTRKYGLPWEISEDALEDNIEGQALENIIASLFAEQMGLDMEDIALNGDTLTPADTALNMVSGINAISDPVDIVCDDVSGFPRTCEAGYLKIDNECFAYESIDIPANTFKNCSRAQNDTVIAVHADDAAISWVKHPLIGVDDGWLKQLYAGGGHYVDLGDISSGYLSKDHFFSLYRALPRKYTRVGAKSRLRWLMSSSQYSLWQEYLTNRQTNAGDAVLGGADFRPLGIEPMEVPPMPDDTIILTDPQNLIVGFWRNIRVRKTDTDRDSIYRDLIFYNSTVRWDFIIEEEEAVAFGDGLKPEIQP